MEIESKTNQNRWQCLFYMIVALANGNFSYQIRRTGSNDELEAMVALCNMLGEELKETFRQHGFLDPRQSYRYIAKMAFILDRELKIINFNKEVLGLLQYETTYLTGRDFKEILETTSFHEIAQLKKRASQPGFKRYTFKLTFRTKRDLSLSANCYISRLVGQSGVLFYSLVSFQPVLFEEVKDSGSSPESESPALGFSTSPIFGKASDLRLVHQARDYILENLNDTIPNIRDFAHRFGTNESKLKEDFRQVFKLTPFQFYNRERMNLAKELILNTPLPLKSIADMTGFKTYPHFSYAFKKEFGYSPYQCRNPIKS